MKNIRFYLLLTIIMLVPSGCNYLTMPSTHFKDGQTRHTQSDQLIAKRKQQAQHHTLSEKALIFESQIFTTYKAKAHYLFGKEIKKNRKLKIDIESTASVLNAMSAKYGVTGDEKDLQKIYDILTSITTFDAHNTLDGYLPCVAEGNSLKIIDNHTHSNAYTQLLAAYLTVAKVTDDTLVVAQLQKQARRIANYFINNNFKMRDQHDLLISHSDISPNIFKSSRSRILDLLAICETLNYILPESTDINNALDKVLKIARQCGYHHKIQALSIQLFDIHIPTHSSDWLNMMRLYILCEISDKKAYHHAFSKLYKEQEDEFNPLFIILAQDHQASPYVKQYLDSFPTVLTNQEVMPHKKIKLKKWPPYVKNKRIVEAKIPVPIYQRPLSTYEWKRNPYRVSGNHHRKGEKSYSGIDFLEAYWLGRYHKLISPND
jgi:hypothetical protein